jgi:hypothetical protein
MAMKRLEGPMKLYRTVTRDPSCGTRYQWSTSMREALAAGFQYVKDHTDSCGGGDSTVLSFEIEEHETAPWIGGDALH